ncbi:ABC transporter permease [Corynebacterium lactis]|uniref:ABC-2 type transporter transmembrane domain-containing protein n=1 Tax=Corynebacterium lactis RW2-5 TaxID=1408189 RepID=A0A0K2H3Z1_9CORY|nr:ABC transporter permease [Corynebacterium lactis]ALA68678.1 hypothetical protein CLAC_09985 [Corynebacterium lactis RW2-5]
MSPTTNNYSASTAIKTVFVRELRESLLKKSSLITLIIMAVATVGGVIAADYFMNKSSNETTKVTVVGEAPFASTAAQVSEQVSKQASKKGDSGQQKFAAMAGASVSRIELTKSPDEAAARTAVTDGDADAALMPGETPGAWRLLADDAPSWLAPILQESLQKQTEAEALAAQGVDAQQFYEKAQSGSVSVEALSPEKEANFPAIIITLIGVMLMVTAILMFGGAVAMSVIEEKSSRVIEIILSTVRPMHLLTGKILGAALAGLIMMSILVISASAALYFTSIGEAIDIPWSAVGLLLPCFILGYFFFAALYAASASLVSRMEDFQGAQTPVLMLSLITMYVPLFGWSKLDSTFMQIAAWIPPVSITTAPLQYAAGNFSALQLAGALVLMALSVVGVIALAAKIYPRNILRTGAAVSWKKALTAKS